MVFFLDASPNKKIDTAKEFLNWELKKSIIRGQTNKSVILLSISIFLIAAKKQTVVIATMIKIVKSISCTIS